MLISVIIPLYNKEAAIAQSLKSVLSQEYDDFEVVIVDDGSTDNSVAIVEAINDSRIRLIKQENGGPSKARNTGVKNAKGEWILFLDGDDELLPNALSHFNSLIIQHSNISFFCCPYFVRTNYNEYQQFSYNNVIINNNFKAHFYHKFLPHTGCAIFANHMINKYLFDERIYRYEDFEQWFRMYREERIFLSSQPVLIVNQTFAAASKCRNSIKEDFVGYINLKGKSFWEKMCLYSLYLCEKDNYKNQIKSSLSSLYKRYDLFVLWKVLTLLKEI